VLDESVVFADDVLDVSVVFAVDVLDVSVVFAVDVLDVSVVFAVDVLDVSVVVAVDVVCVRVAFSGFALDGLDVSVVFGGVAVVVLDASVAFAVDVLDESIAVCVGLNVATKSGPDCGRPPTGTCCIGVTCIGSNTQAWISCGFFGISVNLVVRLSSLSLRHQHRLLHHRLPRSTCHSWSGSVSSSATQGPRPTPASSSVRRQRVSGPFSVSRCWVCLLYVNLIAASLLQSPILTLCWPSRTMQRPLSAANAPSGADDASAHSTDAHTIIAPFNIMFVRYCCFWS
jgi:hypothetical protein